MQGLARRLLHQVAETANRTGRQLLQARTFSTVPAGEAFLEHLGAHLGRTRYINELDIAKLDWDQLRAWQDRARKQRLFEVGIWRGPYPEEDLESMCALHQVAAIPLEGVTLKREEARITPGQLRQKEASLGKDKTERWTTYVREGATKRVVGYTEVVWSPFEPRVVDQGMTCVLPEYRNRGLGRWVKAAMLESVIGEHPEVKRVRTGNATTNAPMLKINHELGFSSRMTRKDWQVDLVQVLSYLERPKTAASV